MREIKFRAWDTLNREMCAAYNISLYDEDGEPTNQIQSVEGTRTSGGAAALWYPHEFVIMQYTGLKDKNGKYVYIGDIISVEGDKYIVEESLYLGFWLSTLDGEDEVNPVDVEGLAEVRGNVFENPELLK